MRACKAGALRAGTGYIYVDWDRCDGCLECVEMCDTGALSASNAPAAAKTTVRPEPAQPPQPASATAPVTRVWTVFDAIVVLAAILGSLLALDWVLGLPVVRLMPPSGRVFVRVAGLAATYAIEMLAVWVLARRRAVRIGEAFGLRPVARSLSSFAVSASLVVGLLLASRALTTVYGLITQQFGWEPTIKWTTDLTQVFGEGWLGLVLAIVLVAFVGPVVEEIAFRGVVQSAFVSSAGALWGIGITALLFGLYHFDEWMFTPTFLLGIALGWLAENRNGLWPPIALHVLYNGLTVVAVFWVAAN